MYGDQDLPIRSQFLGLDRARAETAFEWGQGQARQYQQKGDRYLRGLFVAGALAVIRYAKIHGTKHRPWLTALLARKPTKVAAIALANKLARMAWAMMARASATGIPSRWRRNEIAPDTRRDVKVGRGEQHVMQSRSIRRSGQPTCAIALLSNACFWSGPDPRRALWPAVM